MSVFWLILETWEEMEKLNGVRDEAFVSSRKRKRKDRCVGKVLTSTDVTLR